MIETCSWCKREFEKGFFADAIDKRSVFETLLNLNVFCSPQCKSQYMASRGASYNGNRGKPLIISAGNIALSILGVSITLLVLVSNKNNSKAPISNASSTPATIQQPIDPAYDEYMRIGYQLTEEKDYENALVNFEKALAINPNDTYASKAIENVKGFISEKKYYEYMNLGYSLVSKKDSLGAIENFSKALNMRPRDFKAREAIANVRYEQYMQLGDNFIESKDYKAALVTFEMAEKNQPKAFAQTKQDKNSKAFKSILSAAKLTAIDLIKAEPTSETKEIQPKNKVQFGLYLDLNSQIENEQNFEDSFLILSKAFQENPSEQKVKTAFQKTVKQIAASYIRR
ncbi:hypothetical protein B9G53_22645 [Pseudanabaena sp. SR411]|uniref:tetratricopeptide repeat protein n=1 Tax=Pseudanabaena sp. SR411 TaxID=1980935 RepID=UPI000B995BE3|nr:hypothetical protein [Pseudanabaena sp. SR411]OYQ62328.1 hypothetical protein B9G53_22645 [Pseudanabaena sp. SR411]